PGKLLSLLSSHAPTPRRKQFLFRRATSVEFPPCPSLSTGLDFVHPGHSPRGPTRRYDPTEIPASCRRAKAAVQRSRHSPPSPVFALSVLEDTNPVGRCCA